MLAMDVVDTLRHRQTLVDRELQSDEYERVLVDKVRRIYADQGLEVSDDIIAKGVAALREDRFTYSPPPGGIQVALARIYVNRGRWAKRAGLLAVLLAALWVVYQFVYVMPAKRLPEELATWRTRALDVAQESGVSEKVETLYQQGMGAVQAGDLAAAGKAEQSLEDLYGALSQEYSLRIVSRPGTPSGVWRYPDDNRSAQNYYLIVEAVTPDGERLTLPITSEEDGKTRSVSMWGMRVDRSDYERVARDRQEDGIVSQNHFGVKKRGYLIPEYAIPTTGGAITEW